MIGQYQREQDLQLQSHGPIQYTVLEILADCKQPRNNSSQHGPFPGQSLVQTPTLLISKHQIGV
jgi:hypothetical protein